MKAILGCIRSVFMPIVCDGDYPWDRQAPERFSVSLLLVCTQESPSAPCWLNLSCQDNLYPPTYLPPCLLRPPRTSS